MAAVRPFRRLRDDLLIVRQETPDGRHYIVKDPEAGTFYKFDEEDFEAIECFRGASSLEEVRTRYEREHPDKTLSLETAVECQGSLEEMGLLERTVVEKNLMIMEKIRDARRKRTVAGEEGSIFFINFPAINPKRLFDLIHPYLRFFWQPWFVTLCFSGMAAMAWVFVARWEQLSAATIDLYNFTNKSVHDIFLIVLLMFIIDMLHEVGHGLTCKNFGGEVREIGFVLFYFTPAYYCDVSDAYLFEKKSHKLWVTFAGIYIELVICTVATFAWLVSRPDSFLNDLSYKAMLYTGLSTVFFNINPLLKMDGYYVLMDWLDIPDLRERSFEYLRYLAQGRLLGMEAERPVTTRRQRRIFTTYGACAIVYTIAVLIFVFFLARNWLDGLFPGWGLPLAVLIVILMVRKRATLFKNFLGQLWREKGELLMTWRAWTVVAAGSVAVSALIFFPRFPVMVKSPVVLEPERIMALAARTDGFVAEIRVHEGERVRKGDLLVTLCNDDLQVELQRTRSSERLADSRARAYRSQGMTAEALEAETEARQFAERASELEVQWSSLEVRAPDDGVVLTPRLADLLGIYQLAGKPVLELGLTRRMRAIVHVSEWDVRRVGNDQKVRLRLDAFPYRSFEGEVQAVAPAAAGRSSSPPDEEPQEKEPLYESFEVGVVLDNASGELRPGMAGTAKVYTSPRTIAGRIAQASSDLTRLIVW